MMIDIITKNVSPQEMNLLFSLMSFSHLKAYEFACGKEQAQSPLTTISIYEYVYLTEFKNGLEKERHIFSDSTIDSFNKYFNSRLEDHPLNRVFYE